MILYCGWLAVSMSGSALTLVSRRLTQEELSLWATVNRAFTFVNGTVGQA